MFMKGLLVSIELINQDMIVETISAKLMMEVNLISKKTMVRAIKKKIYAHHSLSGIRYVM